MLARTLICALALTFAAPPALADKPSISTSKKAAAEAEAKRKAQAKRKAEAKRKAAEKRRAEKARRAAERRKAEEKRRQAEAAAKRKAEAARKAAAKRKAQAARKAEAKRRAAEAQRRREAEKQRRQAARRQAEEARKLEAKRRAAEAQRRREAEQQRQREAQRRADEARKLEAKRRAVEAQRRREAEQQRQREAERRAAEARKLEAKRRAVEEQRRREAEQARRQAQIAAEQQRIEAERRSAAAEAARRMAEQAAAEQAAAEQAAAEQAAAEQAAAETEARRQLAEAAAARRETDAPIGESAHRLEAERAAKPLTEPAPTAADAGATLTGQRNPRRKDPPMRPIPRPDDAPRSVGRTDDDTPRRPIRRPDDAPSDDAGPPAGRPDDAVADGRPVNDGEATRRPGARPIRDGARPDGPRRGDRRPPADAREDWERTTDRVADQGRRRPPPPVRRPRRPHRNHARPVAPAPVRRADDPRRYDDEYGHADVRRPMAPAPLSARSSDFDDGPSGPIGRSHQGLTAEGPATAPRRLGPGPLPAPAIVGEGRSANDWFDGFTARGAFGDWRYQPIADNAGSTTEERYTVEGLDLYRVDAILDTRWARLQARYESNRGLVLSNDGWMVDLLLGLRAVPGLEGLQIGYQRLDFDYGRVDLFESATGRVLETAKLNVDLGFFDLGYAINDTVTVFGRRFDSTTPRNVYLLREGVTSQISEQLLEVEATAYAAGLTVAHADDGDGLFGGLTGWVGVGPYDIRTLSGGAFLDGGWLTAGGLEAHIGYRLPLGAGFSVGVRDTFTVLRMSPNGLPGGMERDLAEVGAPTDGMSLDFGTVELLNGLHVDLTWSI